MITRNLACEVLEYALKHADFAEIFQEDTRRTSMMMVDGAIDQATVGRDAGVGIRLLSGTHAAYSVTCDDSREGLLRAVGDAAAALQARCGGAPVPLVTRIPRNIHPVEQLPYDVPFRKQSHFVHDAYAAARAYDPLIQQATVSLAGVDQRVMIANSEGVLTEDRRVRCRASVMAMARRGGESQVGFVGPGASKGWEYIESLDPEALARLCAARAVTMLNAGYCPPGVMPVVIAGGFGGVIFHEACGHSLEATLAARGASELSGKLGQKIASELVTAVDDGTMPGEWGSVNIDDEGNPTRRNVLIEKGILKTYMVDRLGSRLMDHPMTGSGRRQDYRYAPTSRMTNTFIAPGCDDEVRMIASTPRGLYCKSMGGGSVNPTTGEFNFAVEEGYLIENGAISRPVRGATLIGRGSEVLMRIDAVAGEMTMAQGMCGSASGSLPTNVGQPTIRVSEMTVGGREDA